MGEPGTVGRVGVPVGLTRTPERGMVRRLGVRTAERGVEGIGVAGIWGVEGTGRGVEEVGAEGEEGGEGEPNGEPGGVDIVLGFRGESGRILGLVLVICKVFWGIKDRSEVVWWIFRSSVGDFK